MDKWTKLLQPKPLPPGTNNSCPACNKPFFFHINVNVGHFLRREKNNLTNMVRNRALEGGWLWDCPQLTAPHSQRKPLQPCSPLASVRGHVSSDTPHPSQWYQVPRTSLEPENAFPKWDAEVTPSRREWGWTLPISHHREPSHWVWMKSI